MDTLRFAAWRLRQHPGWLGWLVFLFYATAGFRLSVLKELTWVGLADDAALACVLGFGASLLASWRGWLRLPVLGLLGFCLAFYNLCNALFYGFFDSLLNLDSWRLLYQADGARQSVKAVLTTRIIALHVVLPLLLLALALWRSRHARPRVAAPGRALLPLAAGALLLAQGSVASRIPLPSENNGVLILGRQLVSRLWHGRGGGEAVRRNMLAALGSDYWVPPAEEYRVGMDVNHPLLKLPVRPTSKASNPVNVVIILMESVRLMELGLDDATTRVAPTLARLAREGVYYTRFYANAHQTVRDEFITLCGAQSYYGGGQEYSMFPTLGIACLPQILKDHGYETRWISSYDANYADKRLFHSTHGIQFFSDIVDLKKRRLKAPDVGWGPSDEDLADYAVDVLNKAHAPFFAEIMTLSNHHPFTGPFDVERLQSVEHSTEGRMYKDYIAGLQYTDKALKRFFDQARKRPWFDDTVFLILGDHSVWLFPGTGPRIFTPAEQVEVYHRTPLIMYSPKHLKPERREVIGSQMDIAPTLLDFLGISAPNAFEGVSLLRDIPHQNRRVMLGNESGWSIRLGDNHCYLTGMECFDYFPPICPAGYERKRRAHACFRTHEDLLRPGVEPVPVERLGEREALELLALGQRLVDNHNHLLLHDALFPGKEALFLQLDHASPGDAGPAKPPR